MTNEQKAKDIAIEIEKSSFLSGFGQQDIVIEEIENAAMRMAEWKDEKINKILKLIKTMIFGYQRNKIEEILDRDINWKEI